jgi:hypothetical protein
MNEALIPALLQTPAVWARRFAYATATGAFLGLIGAFGTFEAAPAPARMIGWVVMLWTGMAIFPPLATVAVVLGAQRGLPFWLTIPFAVALGAVPMTVSATLVSNALIRANAYWNWPETYLQVLIVALPVVGGYVAIRQRLRRGADAVAPAPEPARPPPAAEPALLARLPAKLGRDLICLQMEDHYVRAHTPLGSHLLLMRMGDAVSLLEGLEGMQVHRSWWVARKALTGHRTQNRRTILQLSNGLEAPVARSAAAAVREAGWLA